MNTSLKFGLIGGFILSLFLGFYYIELYKSPLTFFEMVAEVMILIAVIFYGIKEQKKRDGNFINFGKAVLTGLKINTLVVFIWALSLYLFLTFNTKIFNDLIAFKVERAAKAFANMGVDKKLIEQNKEQIIHETTPLNMAQSNFTMMLLLGLVFAMISAAILKTTDKTASPGTNKS